MTDRYFYISGLRTPIKKSWLPVRAYVIAFETSKALHPAKRLGQKLANAAKRAKVGHLHGVYAGGVGFAAMRAINPATARSADWYHAFATAEHSVLALKAGMLRGLATFPRAPTNFSPALETYFDFVPSLIKYAPESAEDDQLRKNLGQP